MRIRKGTLKRIIVEEYRSLVRQGLIVEESLRDNKPAIMKLLIGKLVTYSKNKTEIAKENDEDKEYKKHVENLINLTSGLIDEEWMKAFVDHSDIAVSGGWKDKREFVDKLQDISRAMKEDSVKQFPTGDADKDTKIKQAISNNLEVAENFKKGFKDLYLKAIEKSNVKFDKEGDAGAIFKAIDANKKKAEYLLRMLEASYGGLKEYSLAIGAICFLVFGPNYNSKIVNNNGKLEVQSIKGMEGSAATNTDLFEDGDFLGNMQKVVGAIFGANSMEDLQNKVEGVAGSLKAMHSKIERAGNTQQFKRNQNVRKFLEDQKNPDLTIAESRKLRMTIGDLRRVIREASRGRYR